MQSEEVVFDEIVGLTYEAAQSPELWGTVLNRIGTCIGLDAWTFMHMHDPDDRLELISVGGERMNASIFKRYAEKYAAIDPRIPLVRGTKPGTWVVTEDHFDDRFVERDPFFQEYLIREGRRWDVGGRLFQSNRYETILALSRGHERGRFDRRERQQLHRLLHHISRSLRLMDRFDRLADHADSGAVSMEAQAWAVFSIDTQARLRDANPRAEHLLRSGRMLREQFGQLVCADSRAQAEWKVAVQQCAFTRRPSSVALRDPITDRPYSLTVAANALPGRSPSGGLRVWSRLIAIVAPLDDRPAAPESRLIELFGLTRAEARLAHNLAQGHSVESHAEEVGVTIATARSQVKAVLGKTETRSQVELQRKLALVPALVEPTTVLN